MKESILKDKSYQFAVQVVLVCKELVEKKEYVLSKQLLRSGTAIGALVREGEFAQSRADFTNKLSIALKEANETQYWISLLKDTGYFSKEQYDQLFPKSDELIRMLVASVKTSKS